MQVMIRSEDRQAMDLIMDRSLTAASKTEGKSVFVAADLAVRQRVNKVEKVLGLLDHLDVEDPPANILKKTLRYIEAATGQPLSAQQSASDSFTTPPPFA